MRPFQVHSNKHLPWKWMAIHGPLGRLVAFETVGVKNCAESEGSWESNILNRSNCAEPELIYKPQKRITRCSCHLQMVRWRVSNRKSQTEIRTPSLSISTLTGTKQVSKVQVKWLDKWHIFTFICSTLMSRSGLSTSSTHSQWHSWKLADIAISSNLSAHSASFLA